MKRILVVQTAFLGDVVLTTPLLRELRRSNPDSVITVLTSMAGAAVLEGQHYVDEVVPFDKRGVDRGVLGVLRLSRRLRAAEFDLAIAAQRSARTGILIRLGRIPMRIGFEGAPGAWAYTHRVPWKLSDHAARRYLLLAGPAGGDPGAADPDPEISVLPAARKEMEGLLSESGIGPDEPVMVVSPGSVWATKRWVPEGYAEVIRSAPARGLRPVLVGSPDEKDLCREVAALAGGDVPVLAGRSPIPVLIALMASARIAITNDSGPGHVAAAVGTPVVSIFGPTHPSQGYAPLGRDARVVQHADLECRPCHHHGPPRCPRGHFRCMREVGAGQVLEAVEGLLKLDRLLETGGKKQGS